MTEPKPIRARSADGVMHQFPATTKPDVVQRVMKEYAQKQRGAATDTQIEQTQKQVPTFDPATGAARAKATRETITGPEEGTQQDSFASQQAIEKRLRGEGKTDAEIQNNPEWQAAAKNLSRSVSAADTSTAIGETAGSAAVAGLVKGAKVLGAPVVRTLKTAFGKTAETAEKTAAEAAEKLRGQGAKTGEEAVAAREAEAGTAESHAERIDKIRQKLAADQPKVAAQRAEQRQVGPDMVRQKVLAQTRERARQAEADYRATGASAQQAKDLVIEREARVKAAEEAATGLDAQLAARPTTTADQFGQMVRNATRSISDRYSKIRARASGFGEAIASAGNEPRVPTHSIVDLVDAKMKNLRNPTLRSTLVDLRGELLTDDAMKLNVEAAESLRGTLDAIIGSKMFKDRKIDKETLAIVGQMRKELVHQASEAWKPYKEALAKWRTLSRPLDIVERKGALKKVLDVDPVSTDYATTEAQVVGEVIRKAQQGNPVFERLLSESPELKDAARLYFSKDLIEGGATATPAKMATWFKNNERPLQQLGLLDEFKDIQSAKKAAQQAIEEAKGARVQAVRESTVAAQKEAEAARQSRIADTTRKMAQQRAETNPTAEVTKREVVPRSSLEAKETPKEAVRRLEGKAGEQRGIVEKRRAVADDYRQRLSKMSVAEVDKAPQEVRSFVEKLRSDKYLSDTQYKDYLKRVQEVEDLYKKSKQAASDKAKAISRLKKIGQGILYAGVVGYPGYKIIKGLTGF